MTSAKADCKNVTQLYNIIRLERVHNNDSAT